MLTILFSLLFLGLRRLYAHISAHFIPIKFTHLLFFSIHLKYATGFHT